MPIVFEQGAHLEAISSESGYAGGFTISEDHDIPDLSISLHTSLCKVDSTGALPGDAAIGIAEFLFLDPVGIRHSVVFGPAPPGGGTLGDEDKWAAQIWKPRVVRFTIAVFALRAAMKGSWFLQAWE